MKPAGLNRKPWLHVFAAVLLATWTSLVADADVVHDAQTEVVQRNVQFTHLTSAEGLSQEMVNDIVQDSRGFVWIATQEGLNRYDGYQIKAYESVKGNDSTLAHDFVRTLLIDRDGVLWVGTEAGVNRYDVKADVFDRRPLSRLGIGDLPEESIRSMLQTRDGVYWFGTDSRGLFRVDPRSRSLRQYRHDAQQSESLPDDSVISLLEDTKGNLWVGTLKGGLSRFDPLGDRFLRYGSDLTSAEGFIDGEVRVIYEDRTGFIWVGTGDRGVARMDPKRGTFERFAHDHEHANAIGSNRVRDITEDSNGTLWFATDAGLAEWQESGRRFTNYSHLDGDPRSLVGDRVNSVFTDASGVLWVGTWNGVSRWNFLSDTFNYFRAEDGSSTGDIVTSVAESSDGLLWIGTYGTGLVRLDPASGKVRFYRNEVADPDSLPEDRVMVVHVDAKDRVWVGTRAQGLAQLDRSQTRFLRYVHDPDDSESISGDAITSLHSDEEGALWVGTFGTGLNRMSADADGNFVRFRHDPGDVSSLGGDRVLTLYGDREGGLWVGTEGQGLSRFDPLLQRFKSFRRFQTGVDDTAAAAPRGESDELVLSTVTDIIQDRDGTLWIGSLGQGLLRWSIDDRTQGVLRAAVFSKAAGLPTDTIFGILEDQTGALWLSSNRGLTRFDLESGSTRQFDSRNGLRDSEFNQGARLRSRSGRLLFGSTSGLVGFFPGALPVNQHPPSVVITARTRQQELASVGTGETSPEIEIGYPDRFMTFDFVALDFVSPDKNKYRYMLEGFDDTWQEADLFRRATYINLPSGRFTFRVQAANNDGVWNPNLAEMRVAVIPAPWNTWWAYAGYALLLSGLLGWFLRTQRATLEQESLQRARLEEEVQARTRELAERNTDLQSLNEKLAEASVTDSLTGLRNRRYVDQFIASEISIFDRSHIEDEGTPVNGVDDHRRTMFFMMIDLDGFKLINDRFGHYAGDLALIQIKDILVACSRASDTVIRWGGDEFMIIGTASGFFGVKILAERIRESIASHRYDVGNGNIGQLTASIGIAPYPFTKPGQGTFGWELVTAVADRAAYIAKANGRNAWVSISGCESLASDLLEKLGSELPALIEGGYMRIDSSLGRNLVLTGAEQLPLARVANG